MSFIGSLNTNQVTHTVVCFVVPVPVLCIYICMFFFYLCNYLSAWYVIWNKHYLLRILIPETVLLHK